LHLMRGGFILKFLQHIDCLLWSHDSKIAKCCDVVMLVRMRLRWRSKAFGKGEVSLVLRNGRVPSAMSGIPCGLPGRLCEGVRKRTYQPSPKCDIAFEPMRKNGRAASGAQRWK